MGQDTDRQTNNSENNDSINKNRNYPVNLGLKNVKLAQAVSKKNKIIVNIRKDNNNKVNAKKFNNINDLCPKYFKCFCCPMVVLLNIDIEKNTVSIKCENGHFNEMQIESFLSLYKAFQFICIKCKRELSNLFYCGQCRDLLCDGCLRNKNEMGIHDGHVLLNKSEVNFMCTIHKKKFINFCIKCQRNCCKKCTLIHNSHQLLLIKNEITNLNQLSQLKKLLDNENDLIEKIEEKYNFYFSKNNNEKYADSFKKLLKFRKLENKLKNKLLNDYRTYLTILNKYSQFNKNEGENSDNESENNLLNYYFLKNVSNIENITLTNQESFFKVSPSNRCYQEFNDLSRFLKNDKYTLIESKKHLDNYTSIATIPEKAKVIFPLDDGNFIIGYDTQIVFFDGENGDEIFALNEEIFENTYKIMKLSDNSFLLFGDLLNHIEIDETGKIRVIFTGSHIEILKGLLMQNNEIIYIDKITSNLNILTDKKINWHKEPFPEFSLNVNFKNERYSFSSNYTPKSDFCKALSRALNSNLNLDNLSSKGAIPADKLDALSMQIDIKKDLYLNSIKSLKLSKIKDKLSKKVCKVKTYDILSLSDTLFLALQVQSNNREDLCLRIFDNVQNNKLIDVITNIREPIKKSGVLFLVRYDVINKLIGYGLNDKKFFVIFDLRRKQLVLKVELSFNKYFFLNDGILIIHYQNYLNQYIVKNNDYLFVTNKPFKGFVNSITLLKDNGFVIDDKKNSHLFIYKKDLEGI